MSAYIVEDKTISRIVNRLVHEIRNTTLSDNLDEKLTELGYAVNDSFPERLAQDMFALNVSAVKQRYNDTDSIPPFKYIQGSPISLIQTLKSLNCWMYQCTEGDVPKNHLYKFFVEVFQKYLLKRIVYDLSKYDKAEWA